MMTAPGISPGQKRFITSGDNDLAENILHLVLARPVGVEGAGGPGTKGLSLFLVPKYHFDLETGELDGRRNGIYATGLEDKLGMKVSATCEMSLGADEPAVGWLLGEVHNGIGQMFEVVEDARMMVGAKAVATLSTGYLNALEYAKERVQGNDMAQMSDRSAPRVPIIQHPDIRRSLLTQKAYSEGLRSLLLYAASMQDRAELAGNDGSGARELQAISDLLLPIVKGFSSERAWTVLGTECLQIFGGSGYIKDLPIEQYVRDTKIDTIYEGTTAIQAQDLFFRKIVRNDCVALEHIFGEMADFAKAEGAPGAKLEAESALLLDAVNSVRTIIQIMQTDLAAHAATAENGSSNRIYRVGLNTTDLLYALGDVLVAWLLLRSAALSYSALDSEQSPADREFYCGKIATAEFFARHILPSVSARAQSAELVNESIMDLELAVF